MGCVRILDALDALPRPYGSKRRWIGVVSTASHCRSRAARKRTTRTLPSLPQVVPGRRFDESSTRIETPIAAVRYKIKNLVPGCGSSQRV